MTSRLLRELESLVGSTDDPLVWARGMCRLALYFARQGDTEQSLDAMKAVRTRFEGALGAEVAAWLMLAEGVLNFSQGDLGASADRLRRSYAIAIASNSVDARPICAAWLAHMALNTRRFSNMVSFLRESLTQAKPDDHATLARASLVLADAFHYAGRFDLARPWFEKARLHATNEGDEAAVSAMLHNVAAFRTSNVRLADALGTKLPDEARRASMEAMSAAAYDRAIGTRSFGEFLPHVNEQLLIVDKKYKQALEQLSKIEVQGLPTRVHAVHHVDHATCALQTDDTILADELSVAALDALDRYEMDPDDVAYVCCRLIAILTAVGRTSKADELQLRATAAIEKHRDIQEALCTSLTELTASLGRAKQ